LAIVSFAPVGQRRPNLFGKVRAMHDRAASDQRRTGQRLERQRVATIADAAHHIAMIAAAVSVAAGSGVTVIALGKIHLYT
jgi:hypothetical protein